MSTIHPTHIPKTTPIPVHQGIRLSAFIPCDRCKARSETAWVFRPHEDVEGMLTFCAHHTTEFGPVLHARPGWALA